MIVFVYVLETLAIKQIVVIRSIPWPTYWVDLWKYFSEKFKNRTSNTTASKIQTIFNNFHFIFSNSDNIFLLPIIIISFGQLNLPIETKFYKKLLVGVL